jgi:hypothetical protein
LPYSTKSGNGEPKLRRSGSLVVQQCSEMCAKQTVPHSPSSNRCKNRTWKHKTNTEHPVSRNETSVNRRERERGRARMEETEQHKHKTREDLQRSARPNERLISGTRAPGWETSRRGPGRARSRSSRRRRSSRRPRTGPASPCPALAPGRRRRPLVPSSRGAAAPPRARGREEPAVACTPEHASSSSHRDREHSTPAPVASSSLSLDC